jgi:hypothetical protein
MIVLFLPRLLSSVLYFYFTQISSIVSSCLPSLSPNEFFTAPSCQLSPSTDPIYSCVSSELLLLFLSSSCTIFSPPYLPAPALFLSLSPTLVISPFPVSICINQHNILSICVDQHNILSLNLLVLCFFKGKRLVTMGIVPNSRELREEVYYLEYKRIFSSAARGPFYHDRCQCFRPPGIPGTVEGTTYTSCRCCKFYHRRATITVHQGVAPALPQPAFGA